MSYSHVIKLILLGDTATGKTSLLNKFVNDTPVAGYQTTIGVDFQAKTVRASSGKQMRLHVWDTAGQECFRSIIKAYYRCIAGAFILFDVTDRKSFTSLEHWLQALRTNNE